MLRRPRCARGRIRRHAVAVLGVQRRVAVDYRRAVGQVGGDQPLTVARDAPDAKALDVLPLVVVVDDALQLGVSALDVGLDAEGGAARQLELHAEGHGGRRLQAARASGRGHDSVLAAVLRHPLVLGDARGRGCAERLLVEHVAAHIGNGHGHGRERAGCVDVLHAHADRHVAHGLAGRVEGELRGLPDVERAVAGPWAEVGVHALGAHAPVDGGVEGEVRHARALGGRGRDGLP